MYKRSDKGAELLEIARAMRPKLRERADDAERANRVPAETISEFVDSGLFKAGLAARYGGYEIPLGELCDIIMTLGEACASTAWVYGVLSDHNISVGMFEPQVQEEIWAGGPYPPRTILEVSALNQDDIFEVEGTFYAPV